MIELNGNTTTRYQHQYTKGITIQKPSKQEHAGTHAKLTNQLLALSRLDAFVGDLEVVYVIDDSWR